MIPSFLQNQSASSKATRNQRNGKDEYFFDFFCLECDQLPPSETQIGPASFPENDILSCAV